MRSKSSVVPAVLKWNSRKKLVSGLVARAVDENCYLVSGLSFAKVGFLWIFTSVRNVEEQSCTLMKNQAPLLGSFQVGKPVNENLVSP